MMGTKLKEIKEIKGAINNLLEDADSRQLKVKEIEFSSDSYFKFLEELGYYNYGGRYPFFPIEKLVGRPKWIKYSWRMVKCFVNPELEAGSYNLIFAE